MHSDNETTFQPDVVLAKSQMREKVLRMIKEKKISMDGRLKKIPTRVIFQVYAISSESKKGPFHYSVTCRLAAFKVVTF